MKTFATTLLITLFLAGVSSWVWAHGGGHNKESKKEEVTLPELPDASIDMKDTGAIDYGVGDPMDSFEMEEVEGGGPLWGEAQQPEMSEHEGHDMSKMKQVKLAEHEWVSTSQKGYGWAATLTVLSGALFGFLTFRRPFE